MHIHSRLRRSISFWLVCAIACNSIVAIVGSLSTVQAQRRRIIVVNAEQPNLWTLEQAHYLLAQMHRRNLDLKTKSLGELDPNEIAGLRFDVMRMLVEFGATFNQADLATNRLLSENRTFNAERRQQLMTERDSLRREALRLTGEIEELENEKAGTEDEDEKKRIDARIAAKNTRLARVDKESELLNEELKTLTAPSGDPKATTGGATFEPEKLPKSEFDEAFKAAAKKQIEKFNDSPQLNASLRLDNFLQMQYEIISKQLSLLRDELGPGERLVFLELPQTVNAAHHESKRKWAQSWWKIAGYTHRVPVSPGPRPAPTPRLKDTYKPITTTEDINSILRAGELYKEQIRLPLHPCETHAPTTYSNSTALAIGNSSSITVSDSGRVRRVTVTLHGFDHDRPGDVDLLLVGPRGQNALILSDVGGTIPARNLTITLDDASRDRLSAGRLLPGIHPPFNADANLDPFPSPAPVPLGNDVLSIFNATDAQGEWKLYTVDDDGQVTGKITRGWSLNISTDCVNEPGPIAAYVDEFVNLDRPTTSTTLLSYLNLANERAPLLEDRTVRTVELIPRQSSLNVNDMNLNVRAGAFNFVLSTLFGFGSQLKVQRQREQFTQFVQQELYSAAFGKGAREFGWTFTPMPGMDGLQSGVRTTYAVVVVPAEATSLVLEANGCYFPRSSYQPSNFNDTKSPDWNEPDRTSRNCGGTTDSFRTKAFVVPIPAARVDGGNEFWVDRIDFTDVAAGKQIVVAIRGKNFSPQTGVLINGVPLVHSIGLAQPLLRDDSETGRRTAEDLRDQEIKGRIERVDSEKIIFSFKMAQDYKGTPTITLIAPGRATNINGLELSINDQNNVKLKDFKPRMFGHTPDPEPFRIDSVKVFRRSGTLLTALVTGAGFGATQYVFVNGRLLSSVDLASHKLISLQFDAPREPSIKITIVSQDADPAKRKTVESEPVANPGFLSVSNVEIITYEAATEEDPTAMLVVKITGTGFTDDLKADIADVSVKSATEAILTIPNPKAAAIVTLKDEATGQTVKVVVTRKSKSSGTP